MSPQGVFFTDLLLAVFGVAVIWLLLRGKLYVGYAVIWLLVLLVAGVLVTIEPLQMFFTRLVGAVFPASALTLGALAFIILLLIYFTVQLTILGDRVTQLAQQIALDRLEREQPPLSSRDPQA